MEEKFLKAISEVINADVSELTMDLEYKKDERWDSLVMMNIVMELEDQFGVSIPIEKLADVKKLRDLYEMIK